MKKKGLIITGLVLILGVAGIITCGIVGMVEDREARPQDVTLVDLPKPELAGGLRGEMGIDKNINETNIDQYLGRDDAIYRDMRMLVDDANYEAIGGDSYLSGYVEGFEVVPYPLLVNVEGLPEAVGESYTGTTLFTQRTVSLRRITQNRWRFWNICSQKIRRFS